LEDDRGTFQPFAVNVKICEGGRICCAFLSGSRLQCLTAQIAQSRPMARPISGVCLKIHDFVTEIGAISRFKVDLSAVFV
jgi:hypothetical protein